MKALLAVLLTLFAVTAVAQTGVYMDRTIVGEGITVYQYTTLSKEENRTVYFYTFGKEQCETAIQFTEQTLEVEAVAVCPNSIFPPFAPLCDPVVQTNSITLNVPSLVETCDYNGQRWFVGSDRVDAESGDSVGKLYIADGIDFPECIPSLEPFEEDVVLCADLEEVGLYVLRPNPEGGYLFFIKAADPESTDPAFGHTYNFDTGLIEIDQEPVAEPK